MKYLLLIIALCFSLAVSYDEEYAYAVKLGFPVTMSTLYDASCGNYQLDNVQREGSGLCQSWVAGSNDVQQWIQVSSIVPQTWEGVITQGRGDAPQWVTNFMVLYSDDGVNWTAVDDGRVFQGNSDQNTHVTNYFDTPVTARTLRIKPTAWNSYISMRFDALFQLEDVPKETPIEAPVMPLKSRTRAVATASP